MVTTAEVAMIDEAVAVSGAIADVSTFKWITNGVFIFEVTMFDRIVGETRTKQTKFVCFFELVDCDCVCVCEAQSLFSIGNSFAVLKVRAAK